MKIVVRKPTEEEKRKMKANPTWGCGVSEFDWHYSDEEHALIIEGEVIVEYVVGDNDYLAQSLSPTGVGDNDNVLIKKGDYVVFPRGLSCRWKVTKAVEKYYEFR